MKVTREESERNRQAVVSAASRLFRERGFDGVGLVELTQAAGLTPGGFYKKFGSKSDLVAEACAQALAESGARISRVVRRTKKNPVGAALRSYLSKRQRDNAAECCPLVTLGADVARQSPELREAFEKEIKTRIDWLKEMGSRRGQGVDSDQAVVALSTMVGALLLSRVVVDPKLSEKFLEASGHSIAVSLGEKGLD